MTVAEAETFTAPESIWEPIIRMCLKHTRWGNLPALREDMDNRIDRFLASEFPDLKGDFQPCGMGPRSETYDRQAFGVVLRQLGECEACKAGKKEARYCSAGGKLWDVFRQGNKLYVWYRPALCKDWLATQAQERTKTEEPVITGKSYGFGR